VTIDTGANITVTRPDIAAGWPERQTKKHFTLQTVSGEALPIIKEVFLTLTLGRRPLKIWVFVADITNEFILGLDILCAYDATVDIGCQTLRLAEEVSLWSPGARPRPSKLTVEKDQVIPAQCERTFMARLESPLGVENGLVEPSPQAHPPERIYIARTLVKEHQNVPMRVLNATHHEQKLTRGSVIVQCEPVTLITTPNFEQLRSRDSTSKMQDISEAARPHLSNKEFESLIKLLTEYEDIFAVNSDDH
jgi:hypothetical protein